MQESRALLKPLNQDERLKAVQYARNAVRASYGDAPRWEQFAHAQVELHPKSVRWTITTFCIVVLLAAFSVSAMRLYFIGALTFGASIPDEVQMQIAGIATVVLAETAQLVSTLALATFGKTRTARVILYSSAFAATGVALVGNAQVALVGKEITVFAVLDAFVPPLLVLGMAQILKMQWMHAIEERFHASQAFKVQFDEWQANINADAAQHPQWRSYLANALRDELRRINARSSTTKVLLPELTGEDWSWLVQREMQADQWFLPAQPQPAQVAIRREPVRALNARTAAPRLPKPKRQGRGGGGNSTDEILNAMQNHWSGEDGKLHVKCPYCENVYRNSTEKGLRLALTAHLKVCKERNVTVA